MSDIFNRSYRRNPDIEVPRAKVKNGVIILPDSWKDDDDIETEWGWYLDGWQDTDDPNTK